MRQLTSIEFCAGAGGQALGLETAGFSHDLLLDNDEHCCATLRLNRPDWNVVCADMQTATAFDHIGVDLFAGGLPCPPFSVAGKQLGEKDERNLFDDALRLISESKPKFVLIENVRGFVFGLQRRGGQPDTGPANGAKTAGSGPPGHLGGSARGVEVVADQVSTVVTQDPATGNRPLRLTP